jgi:nucleoside 2-deoxyribosyltransferase/sugar/nucleoside kinase (ribokinase family)
MPEQTILIIGEVFIDTHLDIIDENGPLVRLGGIFHSARAFSSLGLNYAMAYFAPVYLDDDINEWSCFLNTKGCYKLGNINRAPNIFLIQESKEAGDQGYYNIIKDQAEYSNERDIVDIIRDVDPTDILVFPGRYDTKLIMNSLNDYKGRVHIDFHYDSDNILDGVKREIESIILSTSSTFFKEVCGGSLDGLISHFSEHSIGYFLVKENRGGSYCYSSKEQRIYESASFYVPTMHSVGVGDVYNSFFISNLFQDDLNKRMRLAALCAAKYAETMSYDKFKVNAQLVYENIDELSGLKGIRLSWESRCEKNIYLAAPDFPGVDTTLLDRLNDSLIYHNFRTRLPIRENGLVTKSTNFEDELRVYQSDIQLLDTCDLLIAILLYNDPGTLVELGMFKQAGKPTIIYDPFNYCENMFVRHTPDHLCKTIEDVIEATYLCLGRG